MKEEQAFGLPTGTMEHVLVAASVLGWVLGPVERRVLVEDVADPDLHWES